MCGLRQVSGPEQRWKIGGLEDGVPSGLLSRTSPVSPPDLVRKRKLRGEISLRRLWYPSASTSVGSGRGS